MRTDAELPALLFMIFIHVADVDGDITPQEVQGLNNLLDDPRWTASELLRNAVAALRANYTSIWAEYDTNQLSASLEDIDAGLGRVFEAPPAEAAAALHAGLREYLRRLGRTGTASFPLLGATGVSEGRAKAHRELEALLDRFASDVEEARSAQRRANAPSPRRPPHEPEKTGAAERADLPRRSLSTGSATSALPAIPSDPGADAWAGGRMRVRCVRVIQETADVKSYVFAPVAPAQIRFKAGQFTTLELPVPGRSLRRSYTISSSPSRPFTLSITVKRLHLGWVSNWLYDTMAVGTELDMLGPSGRFTYADHPADKLLMISAGSGVTPMMSMLRHLADVAAPSQVCFVNNVRTPADIIFERELLQLSAELGPSLSLRIVPARLASGQSWNGLTGSINPTLLQALVPDLLERETFLCGPAGYMTTVREILESLDYPMSRLHEESFGGASPLPGPSALPGRSSVPAPGVPSVEAPRPPFRGKTPVPPVPPGASASEVVFDRSGKVVQGRPGETVLELAARAGIALESSCRSGACGVCRITKLTGFVEMAEQNVLTGDEIEAGEILACSAVAHGRVVLDA